MTPSAVLAAIEADRVRWLDHVPTCLHDTTGRGRCADCCEHMSAAAAVAALWSQGDAATPVADDPEADGTDTAHPAWWRGNDAGCKGSLALIAQLRAEVDALKAQLAAAQPVLLLDAIRRGPPSTWVRCLACGGARVDVDGAPCEPCRGTGQQPPPVANADRAQLAALTGAEFAEQYPYAAAGVAHKSEVPR